MGTTEPNDADTNELTFRSLGPFEQVRRDQRQTWRSGQRVLVESYLENDAALANDAEGVLDLICQEMLLREEAGEPATTEELQQRFPKFATVGYLHSTSRGLRLEKHSLRWSTLTAKHFARGFGVVLCHGKRRSP